jgi:hypothetical protein
MWRVWLEKKGRILKKRCASKRGAAGLWSIATEVGGGCTRAPARKTAFGCGVWRKLLVKELEHPFSLGRGLRT